MGLFDTEMTVPYSLRSEGCLKPLYKAALVCGGTVRMETKSGVFEMWWSVLGGGDRLGGEGVAWRVGGRAQGTEPAALGKADGE